VRELDKARRVEVYDQKTGKSVPYILYHLVDVNGRLFSRATTVWRALQDTRICRDGHLVDDPARTTPAKPRIVKEAWRQLVRQSEAHFYERIEERIPEDERYGLPTMVCGGDMGSREMRWWEETVRRREASEAALAQSECGHAGPSTSTPSGDTSDSDPYDMPPKDFPLPYPQQQTYSWRLLYRDTEQCAYLERSHMRIVVDDVGRPLTQFTCTRELVQAIRDAIVGHRLAREKAQVLHRDVSIGNILIVDEPKKKGFGGFLHDYDYSSIESEDDDEGYETGAPSSPRQTTETQYDPSHKERTGTYYFMAFEILQGGNEIIVHHIHHDLESFYWVLLWVVLRHTNHDHPKGQHACTQVFKFGDDSESSAAKLFWILNQTRSPLGIPNNEPLTTLLHDLTDIVGENFPQWKREPLYLTYDRVLEKFDAALAKEGWPDNDFVRCELLDPRTVSQVGRQPTGSTCLSGARPESSGPIANAIFGPPAHLLGASRSAPPGSRRSSSKRIRLPEAVRLPNTGSGSNKRFKPSCMGPPALPTIHSRPGRARSSGQTINASQRSRERGSVPPTRSSERIRAAAERKTTSSGSGS
ncbi:hypothetical protein BV20DRAFT_749729, partial [Pilatotrama ljubarskyi]